MTAPTYIQLVPLVFTNEDGTLRPDQVRIEYNAYDRQGNRLRPEHQLMYHLGTGKIAEATYFAGMTEKDELFIVLINHVDRTCEILNCEELAKSPWFALRSVPNMLNDPALTKAVKRYMRELLWQSCKAWVENKYLKTRLGVKKYCKRLGGQLGQFRTSWTGLRLIPEPERLGCSFVYQKNFGNGRKITVERRFYDRLGNLLLPGDPIVGMMGDCGHGVGIQFCKYPWQSESLPYDVLATSGCSIVAEQIPYSYWVKAGRRTPLQYLHIWKTIILSILAYHLEGLGTLLAHWLRSFVRACGRDEWSNKAWSIGYSLVHAGHRLRY